MVWPGHAHGLRTDAVAHTVGGRLFDCGRGTAHAVYRVGAAARPRCCGQGVGDLHRVARHRPPPRQRSPLGSQEIGLIVAVSADLCGYVEHSVEYRRAISSVWCREYELNGQTWVVKGQFVTDCP